VSRQHLVVGLGELLWDLLPTGKRLGGAPANFAVMSARLGNHAVIASRIGADALGDEALARLSAFPADLGYIQRDTQHPTGSVSVALHDGQAEYIFERPVAWDFLAATPQWLTLARHADAVCFGTLAQRDEDSRKTIAAFLSATSPDCLRIFDVNLRQPFFSAEVLSASLSKATLVKLNDAEMQQVLVLLGFSSGCSTDEASLLQGAKLLLKHFPVRLVCITMGPHGSLLVTQQSHHRHHGFPATVADTVGAGDAFTAALVHYYLQNAPLTVLNEAGNRWGSWVTSQPGAMPDLPPQTQKQIETSIQQATTIS